MDHSRAGDGAGDEVTVAARSSLIDSLKGCGLSGIRIDKQQLNTKVMMPHYLRFALRDSIRLKDPIAGASATTPPQNVVPSPPEAPLVVFINPRSGGRHGQKLKQRLQELISEEQVPPSKKCFPLSILWKNLGIPIFFFFFSCVSCYVCVIFGIAVLVFVCLFDWLFIIILGGCNW